MSTMDVIIAGGGPNGLLLACELRLAGVRPVVVERLPGRSHEHRANGLVGQVVRMLHRRGLYERLSGMPGPPIPAPRFVFGGLPLLLDQLPDNPLTILGLPQRELVRRLEEHARELGVDLRYGHDVTALAQDGDGVTVEVNGPAGIQELRARFLVGADGGHSTVRKLAGIGFPGVTREDTVSRSTHVSLPASVLDPVTGGVRAGDVHVPPFFHFRTDHGVFVHAPFAEGPPLVTTLEWNRPADEQAGPMSLDEMRASIRRVLGADIPLSPPEGNGPHLLRRLTGGNTRLAESFRAGRVLLLGDAAHVHSAIGGPGLNLGLQDAVNLGWKLAGTVRGWAPDDLLDTYESERRPVSERVVMHTQAQSALISPGAEITALRELFAELLGEERVVRHIADLMSGADIRYDWGLPDPHPLVGRWAPDLEPTEGGEKAAELMKAARPVLLDFSGTLGNAVEGWNDRVDLVEGRVADGPTALLIRPDGYVAWASSDHEPDRETLRTALTRWFGAPTAGIPASFGRPGARPRTVRRDEWQ
ncbi:FAD-dependent monooxygenase [Pseudonocardia yunnanensis]|uniref:FAD-dependent monooxygenase n=1 Tax=Pseudonocardia yunnanensis TaxID=58107 RepID=A0ABW4EUZ0_9PSEU